MALLHLFQTTFSRKEEVCLLEEHSLIAAQQVVGEERNAAGSCEHRAVCSILMGARWLSLAVS